MEIIPDISTNLSPTKSFSTFRNSKLSTNKRGRSTKVLINPNNLSLSLFFKMNIALLQLNEKTKRCSIDFLTSKCSCSCVCHQTKSICVRMFTSATERSRLKLISVCFSLFLHRVSKWTWHPFFSYSPKYAQRAFSTMLDKAFIATSIATNRTECRNTCMRATVFSRTAFSSKRSLFVIGNDISWSNDRNISSSSHSSRHGYPKTLLIYLCFCSRWENRRQRNKDHRIHVDHLQVVLSLVIFRGIVIRHFVCFDTLWRYI